MESSICPYCGDALASSSTSRDHIFMYALGGTAIVRACRSCNSKLGHEVEGLLLKANQLLNLVRLAAGAGGQRVPGTLPDEREVTWDPRSRFLESQNPVERRGDGFVVSGSPDQVRAHLSRMRRVPEQIEKYMSSVNPENLGGQDLQLNLRVEPVLWARFTAKAALGAGYSVAPKCFTSTPIAENLRKICSGRINKLPTMASADMQDYEREIDKILDPFLPGYRVKPLTAEGRHQMLFVPQEKSTICIASLKGVKLFGIVVPGNILNWVKMPVVLTDNETGGISERYIEDDIKKALVGK
ncbi:HNH endonuclease [Kocuria varians]|uniref:HNH endonuclease 5 domain-containing protein n=1 Tax=Kocuria varians TaxID=1272 RepID=A0A7D7Q7V4_KOCVA|nr:hypothetical protein CIB50_0000763 [Kocuria varians]